MTIRGGRVEMDKDVSVLMHVLIIYRIYPSSLVDVGHEGVYGDKW